MGEACGTVGSLQGLGILSRRKRIVSGHIVLLCELRVGRSRDVPLPHQHVCGRDGGAVLDDAVDLLPLHPDSWQRQGCLLSGNVCLVTCRGPDGKETNETPRTEAIFFPLYCTEASSSTYKIGACKFHLDDPLAPPLRLPLPVGRQSWEESRHLRPRRQSLAERRLQAAVRVEDLLRSERFGAWVS